MKYHKPDMVEVGKPIGPKDAVLLYNDGDSYLLYTY